MREAIEAMRGCRSGRDPAATHNLDEATGCAHRVAFVRGGLLRVDSPAGLRGALGGHGRLRSLASARMFGGRAAVEVAAARSRA